MKFNNFILPLLMCCLVLTCAKEPINDTEAETTEARLATGQFDESYQGVYKGLFSTNDGLTRGSVVVIIDSENRSIAKITLSSGAQIELISSKVKLTVDNTVSNLRFSSTDLSAIDASFDFSVEGDGLNPAISNVLFDNQESDILIAKNLSRAPLNTITGTYVRTAGTGGFPSNNRTWNVMSIGAGNQTYATQIFYGNRLYTTMPTGVQNNCVPAGSFTTCDVTGSARILGYNVSWSGTHKYDNSTGNEGCSEVSGTWSAPGYGNSSGTFVSDSDCSAGPVVVNNVCADATSISPGQTITGSTVNSSVSDAPESCNLVSLNTGSGVWFKYTPSVAATVVVNTNGSNYNTKLGVFSGSCGSLICIDADDDDGEGVNSMVEFQSCPNQTYYFYVTGFSTEIGNYVVNLTSLPPVAPTYTSTTNVACGGSVIDDGGPSNPGNYGNNRLDIYYIDAGEGMTASLTFNNNARGFNLEDGFDFLRIYDNADGDKCSAQITMTTTGEMATADGFTGTTLRGKTVVSTGRYLTVVFESDISVTRQGFNATVSCMAGRQNVGLQQTDLTFRPQRTPTPSKEAVED